MSGPTFYRVEDLALMVADFGVDVARTGTVLMQRLYARAARFSSLTDNVGGILPGTSVEIPSTPAGTHDGNTATLDGIASTGYVGTIDLEHRLRVEYLVDALRCGGVIAHVRNKFAAVSLTGANAAALGTLRASMSGTSVGGTLALEHGDTGETHQHDQATAPGGGAWTAAKLAAATLGAYLVVLPNGAGLESIGVAEMSFEAWGTPATKALVDREGEDVLPGKGTAATGHRVTVMIETGMLGADFGDGVGVVLEGQAGTVDNVRELDDGAWTRFEWLPALA